MPARFAENIMLGQTTHPGTLQAQPIYLACASSVGRYQADALAATRHSQLHHTMAREYGRHGGRGIRVTLNASSALSRRVRARPFKTRRSWLSLCFGRAALMSFRAVCSAGNCDVSSMCEKLSSQDCIVPLQTFVPWHCASPGPRRWGAVFSLTHSCCGSVATYVRAYVRIIRE